MNLRVHDEICQPATSMVHDVRGSPVLSICVARPWNRSMAAHQARREDAHMGTIPLPGGILWQVHKGRISGKEQEWMQVFDGASSGGNGV